MAPANDIPADDEHSGSNVQTTSRAFSERDIEQRAYGLWQADGGKFPETHYWHLAREQLEQERKSGSAHPWHS